MSTALLLLAILAVKVVSQDMAVLFGPNIDLPIANSIIAPDGNERTAVLAGGTFPGPVLFNILVLVCCIIHSVVLLTSDTLRAIR
jgi:hypothetical protein